MVVTGKGGEDIYLAAIKLLFCNSVAYYAKGSVAN
jgi:hypothetical protein